MVSGPLAGRVHTRMRPFSFYVPITRLDDEQRIVEGFVFINEVVEGEGGIRLKRSAMEAATPDYLKWGAVREMHQPSAVGTATAPGCGIEWTDRGAYLRAKIVDDQAWAKVKERVYKGFSIGVVPQLMRGNVVEKCAWPENSLVDRPKDPEAVITLFREHEVDMNAEVDVELLEDLAPDLTRMAEPGKAVEPDADDVLEQPDRPDEEGRLPAHLHYDCGNETCHGHLQHAAALRCAGERTAGEKAAMGPQEKGEKDEEPGQEMKARGTSTHYSLPPAHSSLSTAHSLARMGTRPDEKEGGHRSPPEGFPEDRDEYADPTNFRYPVDTEEHARAAWSYIHQERNRRQYSDAELAFIEARIKTAAKKFGIELSEERSDTGLPTAHSSLLTTHEELVARLEAAAGEQARMLTRMTSLERDLERTRQRIADLESLPAPGPQPVRYPAALERDFAANFRARGSQADQLRQEYHELTTGAPDPDPVRRFDAARRITEIRLALQAMGELE